MQERTSPLGTRIILLYLLAAYVVPACALFALGVESAIYRSPSLSPVEILYGLLLFATVIFFSLDYSPVWKFRAPPLNPPRFVIEAAGLVLLVGAVAVGFGEGLSRWRYSSTGLSENLSISSLAYAIGPTIFEILLFTEIFLFPDVPRLRMQRRIIVLLLSTGLALTASGIGPALLVAVAFLYAIFPLQFRVLIFRNYTSPGVGTAAKLGVIPLAAAGVVSLLAAFVIGDQIKTGADSEVVTAYWGQLSLQEYAAYLVERFSTAWISLRAALAEYTTISWSSVASNLWAPVGNFIFRLDALTGGAFGIQRPYAGSLMRLNYELIVIYPLNDREGTSPGLIGGFVMAFPMPISLVALGGYTYLVRKIINYLASGFVGTTSWLGAFLALYFLYSLFVSPIDYFSIFDNGFISFAGYAGIALLIRSRFKKGIRRVGTPVPA